MAIRSLFLIWSSYFHLKNVFPFRSVFARKNIGIFYNRECAPKFSSVFPVQINFIWYINRRRKIVLLFVKRISQFIPLSCFLLFSHIIYAIKFCTHWKVKFKPPYHYWRTECRCASPIKNLFHVGPRLLFTQSAFGAWILFMEGASINWQND